MPGHFVIAAKDLESGARDYAFTLSPGWLASALHDCEIQPAPGAEGRLAVHAAQTGTDVLLDGTVQVDVQAPCARCLDPAGVPIAARFRILMVRRAGLDEARLEEGDVDWEVFDGERIVLDDLCREQILLEVPMNPLCSPDCAGIPYAAREKN